MKLSSSRKGMYWFIWKKKSSASGMTGSRCSSDVKSICFHLLSCLFSELAPFLGNEFLSVVVRWSPVTATPFKLFAPHSQGVFPVSCSKSHRTVSHLDGLGHVPTPKPVTVPWLLLDGLGHVPIPKPIRERDLCNWSSMGWEWRKGGSLKEYKHPVPRR